MSTRSASATRTRTSTPSRRAAPRRSQPGNIAWTIYDADGLAQAKAQVDGGLGGGLFYGQTFQRTGVEFDLAAEQQILERDVKVGKVKKADTLEELARQMDVPAAGFLATVKRYNEIVAMKDDVDFGKRAELLTPIVKPPFYAGKLLSTLLTMSGGLSTNSALRGARRRRQAGRQALRRRRRRRRLLRQRLSDHLPRHRPRPLHHLRPPRRHHRRRQVDRRRAVAEDLSIERGRMCGTRRPARQQKGAVRQDRA